MLCGYCQTQNPPGVRFCQQCGQLLWTGQEMLAWQQARAAMASRVAQNLPPEVRRPLRRGPFLLLFTLARGCLGQALIALLICGLCLSFFAFGGALFGRAPVAQFSNPGVVGLLAWSPDGTRIAAGSNDHAVRIWDVRSGRQLLVHQNYFSGPENLAWSHDSSRIASVNSDQSVQIWDAATGQAQRVFRQFPNPKWLAWSPDGTRLAVDGPHLGMVQILDVQSGKTLVSGLLDPSGGISVAAWSPNGEWLALGSDDSTVRIWRADGTGIPRVYTGHHLPVNSLAWSPDSTHIVSVGTNIRGTTDEVQVWDVATLDLAYAYSTTLVSSLTIHTIGWSPDGKHIAMGTESYVFQIWDAETGLHLQTYGTNDESILTLAWSPNSTRIAEAGESGTISIYSPHAVFIGRTSLYDLVAVGVVAAALILLSFLVLAGRKGPPGRALRVRFLILLICLLAAVLMMLMITSGLNPLFWDTSA